MSIEAHEPAASSFQTVPIAGGLAARCLRSGSGKPLIVLQEGGRAAPSRFHELLARHCEVTLLAVEDGPAFSPETLGETLSALDRADGALMSGGALAAVAMEYALAKPGLAGLVLKAPRLELSESYSQIVTPILVIEGTANSEGYAETGQQITALLPECYHVLIFDASEALDEERPEAAAEVIGDFTARGRAFVAAKSAAPIFP